MLFELPEDIDNLNIEELREYCRKALKQYKFREAEITRLREEVRFFATAIENIPNALIIKDETGNIKACSQELGKMFGRDAKMIVGRASLELDEFFSREECIQFQDEDNELLVKGDVKHYEKEFKFADGEMHPCFYWSKGFDVPDTQNGIKGIVSEFVDITKEKKLEADLEMASQIDHGTGLYNRYVFDKQTKSIIDDARENGTRVYVMMCDLDHFKRVNDTFGHVEGDSVLRNFADVIRGEIRESIDVPIRYGGEEFVIFLPNTDLDSAKSVAENIRLSTMENIVLPDKSNITVSIGLVRFDPSESRDQCIDRADYALYTAKSSGRNKVVVVAND